MATVDGKTSIKIDQLINDTVVDGEIVGSHLILRTRGGAEIDAGSVSATSVSPLDFMPVGYIYMSVLSTSPATLFGGSWVRIGHGRVLVGQDPSQTEFDTAEETGGEKTHTITTSELPSHAHSVDHTHASGTAASDGNHTHVLIRKTAAGTNTGVVRGGGTSSADGTTEAGGSHTHSVSVPAYSGNSGSIGSGTAANNLQPYLVVYMWKRVSSSSTPNQASFLAQSSMIVNGKRRAVGHATFSAQSTFTVNGKVRAVGHAIFSAQSVITASATTSSSGSDIVIAFWGDNDVASSWTPSASALSRMNSLSPTPDYFAQVGDTTSDGSAEQYTVFKNGIDSGSKIWLDKLLITPGNHDYDTQGDLDLWWAAFGSGTAAHGTSASAPWWSLVQGNWLILGLIALPGTASTNLSITSGHPQYTWVQNQLAANTGKNILATWHVPRYIWPDDRLPTPVHSETLFASTMLTDMWDLLQSAGADIIVNGHIHMNERFPKADSDANIDATGIREFVVGTVDLGRTPSLVTGSALPIDWHETPTANSAILVITLKATSYDWKYVLVSSGAIIDSGTQATNNG